MLRDYGIALLAGLGAVTPMTVWAYVLAFAVDREQREKEVN